MQIFDLEIICQLILHACLFWCNSKWSIGSDKYHCMIDLIWTIVPSDMYHATAESSWNLRLNLNEMMPIANLMFFQVEAGAVARLQAQEEEENIFDLNHLSISMWCHNNVMMMSRCHAVMMSRTIFQFPCDVTDLKILGQVSLTWPTYLLCLLSWIFDTTEFIGLLCNNKF